MPNPLADRIKSVGISKAELARTVGVPESSIYNWINTGAVRSPQHRAHLARILLPDTPRREALQALWPDSAYDPEVLATTWERFTDIPDEWWIDRFADVDHHCDILVGSGDTWFTLRGALLGSFLAAREAEGRPVAVRVLSADPGGWGTEDRNRIESNQPGSTLAPGTLAGRVRNGINGAEKFLDPLVNGELREYRGDHWSSVVIYRFDGDLIDCGYLYGTRSPHSPAVHYNEHQHPGHFEAVMRSFEMLWNDSE